MNTQLHWKKGILACTFNITQHGTSIGQLKDSEFSRTARGQLHHRAVAFRRCERLFHSYANILDQENREEIGRIYFSPWLPAARIDLEGQTFQWSPSNLWGKRWKIDRGSDRQIDYTGWSGKGRIEVREQHDLLVLAGLYISNYYWRLAVVMSAVIFLFILLAAF